MKKQKNKKSKALKRKALKDTLAIRVVAANPTEEMIRARRYNWADYCMHYSYCRTYSFVDTNTTL
jgi:hypothetical protein